MRVLTFCLALCLGTAVFAEEPWGKDASLVRPVQRPKKSSSAYTGGALSRAAQGFIRFHQIVLSPADGPRSHFYPCSSQYALTAIRKYGLIYGVPMACDRLMRENKDPWVYRWKYFPDDDWIKYDPVPELAL